MNNTAKLAQIDAIFAKLPKIECKRKCQGYCGPVLMSRLEWQRICRQLGGVPKERGDLTCPMLKNGLCSIYAIRPLVCRLFGIVRKMSCPHGCQPERWLSEEEERQILCEVHRIGNSL